MSANLVMMMDCARSTEMRRPVGIANALVRRNDGRAVEEIVNARASSSAASDSDSDLVTKTGKTASSTMPKTFLLSIMLQSTWMPT